MSEAENKGPVEAKESEETREEEMDTNENGGGDQNETKEVKEEEEKVDDSGDKKAEGAGTPKATPKKSPKKQTKKEEESEEESDDEEEKLGLLEQPVVLEAGRKRETKKVERLDVSSNITPKSELKIPEGSGEKLGDIPRIELAISKIAADELKPLHRLLFNKPGSATMIRRNLRKFNGFDFKKGSPEYEKKTTVLNKNTNSTLKLMCEALDLERGGNKDAIVERVMEFLCKPENSGKPLPKSKKRKSTDKGKKRKRRSTKTEKKATKKTKKQTKSEDSVDDDDEDDDDDEEAEDEESKDEESDDGEENGEKSDSSEEEEESEEEAPKKKKAKTEPPKKKPAKKAEKPKKEAKKPAKKATPKKVKTPQKKQVVSDVSSDDSSDDDEPLVSKKKPPTDDELKETIKKILEGANLEEITMKTVCKEVYGKYLDFDLTGRKDFIKATVKQIIR